MDRPQPSIAITSVVPERSAPIMMIGFMSNVIAAAGASLAHAHSQLIATPMVPIRVKQELRGAEDYFEQKGRCIFCEILRVELEKKEREGTLTDPEKKELETTKEQRYQIAGKVDKKVDVYTGADNKRHTVWEKPDGTRYGFTMNACTRYAIATAMALHGGLRVYCATFLVFSDYMRGAVRVAALSQAPVTYVWTHDSIGVGEDGPTHQPVEHLMSLRAMPALRPTRPSPCPNCTSPVCPRTPPACRQRPCRAMCRP